MTREEARTFLQKWFDETLNSVRCDHSAEWCEAIDMAIEALSIVRCKDCKWYNIPIGEIGWLVCPMNIAEQPNAYCSRAERRE